MGWTRRSRRSGLCDAQFACPARYPNTGRARRFGEGFAHWRSRMRDRLRGRPEQPTRAIQLGAASDTVIGEAAGLPPDEHGPNRIQRGGRADHARRRHERPQ